MFECVEKFEKIFKRLGDINRNYRLYFIGVNKLRNYMTKTTIMTK
jgi:hypothetical protein